MRAVVFTGAGTKAFCVGGDLKEREGMTDETWRAQHVIFETAAARVLHCPVPVIAAVEGFAMGGGCELAVLSDFVVCGETAVFAVPEVTRGIFPGIGGTQLLPRILGAPMAKEMIFTGRRVDAREAKAIGLVNHVVPAGQARAKALEIAATIADNGPFAVRQAKKAIGWGGETDLETGMILAIEAYNNTVTTDDRLEGVRAFNEKRKPRFTGKISMADMTFTLSDEQKALKAAVYDLCKQYPAEYWRELDAKREYPEAFVNELTKAGYLAVLIPEEYGGGGLGIMEAALILEEIGRAGGNPAACHAQMYIMGTVLRHGTEAQKREYLPKIAAGELRLQAFGVTEPNAGSDTTKLQTTAVQQGRPATWLTARRCSSRACCSPTSCCCSPAPRRWTRSRRRRTGSASSSSTSASSRARGSTCGRSR